MSVDIEFSVVGTANIDLLTALSTLESELAARRRAPDEDVPIEFPPKPLNSTKRRTNLLPPSPT